MPSNSSVIEHIISQMSCRMKTINILEYQNILFENSEKLLIVLVFIRAVNSKVIMQRHLNEFIMTGIVNIVIFQELFLCLSIYLTLLSIVYL